MADLSGGSPRAAELKAELNGETYLIAQGPQGRAWDVTRVPAQGADTVNEYAWHLASNHEGAGFTYDGLPFTYDYADGWDASTPGKLTTWARHAVGQSKTTTNYLGYLIFTRATGQELLMLRGRYVYRYAGSTSPGSTWTGTLTKDFGANMAVAGPPDEFKGFFYIPIIDTSTGVLQRFWQYNPSTDAWTQGPAGETAVSFERWKNLLARGFGNTVETVSGNPMTAGDWAGTVEIGDSNIPITDLVVMDRDLRVLKRNGMFSLDENLYTVDELPELTTVFDTHNGVGTAMAHGKLLIPHKSGLIRWHPDGYKFVGPEQEGALEGDLGKGWGRVKGVAPYGRYAFCSVKDTYNTMGSIVGLEPSRGGRGPLIPHVFHQCTGGWFEGATVMQITSVEDSWLAVIHVDDDGVTAEPWMYRLPAASMTPANDPNVVHARDNANFYTSRISSPGREVKKSWRTFEFWTELNDLTDIPGLQIWGSVDEGSFIQLLDTAGAAATIKTNGFQRVFFPKTSAAVGHHIRLNYKVPTKAGAEGDVAVTMRDMVLRGDLHPLMTNVMSATIVLGAGEHEDKTTQRRTAQKQRADLLALAAPTSAPVTFKDPWGGTGWAKVTSVGKLREMKFQGDSEPALTVEVGLRERPYA